MSKLYICLTKQLDFGSKWTNKIQILNFPNHDEFVEVHQTLIMNLLLEFKMHNVVVHKWSYVQNQQLQTN
jgi:hypothetical protein